MTKNLSIFSILFFPVFSLSAAVQASNTEQANLEEVLVTGDFRENTLISTASSVSVLSGAQLNQKNVAHIEDILNTVPNVNFSAGASRGRFFQIRGVGERSQFVEPVNPSVGLMIDDIDFTGLGAAATSLDVDQVEIFRGPQGTLMGANALAGFIHLKTADVTENLTGNIKLRVGNYQTRTVSGAVSSSIAENVGIRLAVEQNSSDGYVENTYLNRNDTNNIDERTGRIKLSWQPLERWQLVYSAHLMDYQNGYDAFSLDNSRQTLSDEPGQDTLEAKAHSLKSAMETNRFDWVTVASFVDANMNYGYDEDWAYTGICKDFFCKSDEYSSTDKYLRDHTNRSFDTRIISNGDGIEWVTGFYYRNQEQGLTRVNTYLTPDFGSRYKTRNQALYGQLGRSLTEQLKLIGGVRYERSESFYNNTDGLVSSADDSYLGGRVSLEYNGLENTLLYGLVSSGYKSGGYNNTPDIPDSLRYFKSEKMLNYELGFKGQYFDNKLHLLTAWFYQDRSDMQTKQYYLTSQETGKEDDPCPCDFAEYIANATNGSNYGFESELAYSASDRLQFWTNLGFLQTAYKNFSSFSHSQANKAAGKPYNLDGRRQTHAPNVQLAAGIDFSLTPNVTWNIDAEYKDAYYFSASHEQQSDAFTLINTRLNYALQQWNVAFWIKNMTNQDVQTRGFYFGNDPRDGYRDKAHYQFGAPRTFGATVNFNFSE